MSMLCDELGSVQHLNVAYIPKSTGVLKCVHRVLRASLATTMDGNKKDWPGFLTEVIGALTPRLMLPQVYQPSTPPITDIHS